MRVQFALIAAFSAPPAFAGGVRIVEPTGTQNFATLQAAVDAAPSGAVLLVGEGSYSDFIVAGKSLSIHGLPGATVFVGRIVVTGIASDQVVVMSGLRASSCSAPSQPALLVTDSIGHVRFQDCSFTACDWDVADCPSPAHAGGPGVLVSSAVRVAFSSCVFRGGKSEDQDDTLGSCSGGPPGGFGLHAVSSKLVLYDCQLQGGEGGDSEPVGGIGGDAAWIANSQIFASGSAFLGGEGGRNYNAGPPGAGCDAAGGAGCFLNGSHLDEIGCTFQGGFGGFGSIGECSPGNAPGVTGGTVNSLAGPARRAIIAAAVQSDASNWRVSYQGAPGDRPLFLTSPSPQFLISVPFHGAWLLKRSQLLSTKNFGMVPPSGALNGTAPAADLPAGSLLQRRTAQVAVRASVGVYLASARDLVLLDRASGPDCNGNGVSDFVDVLDGAAPDANHNLIPDTCPGG